MAKFEAVVCRDGARFVRQAEIVQNRVHEVAGAVAGEDAPGTIRAVRSGGKSQDKDAGAWIAKARHGTRPVGLIKVGTASNLADALAVASQPRTTLAGNDVLAGEVERRGENRQQGGHGRHSREYKGNLERTHNVDLPVTA